MTRVAVVLCVVAAAVAPRVAHADDAATRIAKRHFEHGEKLFALGQFTEALDEYKAAYDAKPIPAFLFNIGQCYRNLGDYDSAIFSYKKYLQLQPDAVNRDQTEKLIEDLEAKQQAAQEREERDRERRRRDRQREREEADQGSAADATEPAVHATAHVETPFYRKWWFWTGVVLVGAAGGIGAYEATHGGPPTTDLGPVNFRP